MTTGNSSAMLGNPLGNSPTAITNIWSAGNVNIALTKNGADKKILSGSLTANTLATMLSITGEGVVSTAYLIRQDSTSRTIRLKVTLDGTVIYDATSSTVANQNAGSMLAIGYMDSNSTAGPSQPIPFKTSFLIEVASSLTETDTIALYTSYRTN